MFEDSRFWALDLEILDSEDDTTSLHPTLIH